MEGLPSKIGIEKIGFGKVWFPQEELRYGYWSKPWYLVHPKIAGKWMFIPLKMYL
jgi:hypothetical protein